MISVLFAHKSDGGPRDTLFDFVTRWWKHNFPSFELCVGTNDDEVFSRGKARNDAFSKATGDILIVADADTVPNLDAVHDATLAVTRAEAPWVLPYGEGRYYNLSKPATTQILRGHASRVLEPTDSADWEHKITSWAGCLVLPRAAWEAVGGYDERFIGWGYEDNAFQVALDTIWGPHARVDSYCLHLWHPIEPETNFDQPFIEQNRARFLAYKRASGRPLKMREVILGG